MDQIKPRFTAAATATGGRNGRTEASDGSVKADLSVAKEMGGPGRAGDVNGDAVNDLIVGAFQDDNNGSNSGSARVFFNVPLPGSCPGDADGNRTFNFADVTKVLTNFNLTCP